MSCDGGEKQRCDTILSGAKNIFRNGPLWSTCTENDVRGYGERNPHQGCEGRSFSEKLKMWDTGESCPEIVLAPQLCENSEITSPINPRKNTFKATRKRWRLENLPDFWLRLVPLPLGFLGLLEGGAS